MNSGWLVTFAVLLPNRLVLFFPPTTLRDPIAYPRTSFGTLIQIMEKIGQPGVFIIPFFYPIELHGNISLFALGFIALSIYYAGWTRYIVQGRAHKLFFSPIFGIPVPMAVSPVAYFAVWSVLFSSWPLAAATLVLAIGHISVSNGERRRSS